MENYDIPGNDLEAMYEGLDLERIIELESKHQSPETKPEVTKHEGYHPNNGSALSKTPLYKDKNSGQLFYLFGLIILLVMTNIFAYNVTITPPSYDWKYTGGEKVLSFKVCHDSKNQTLSIPVITEVTADSLTELSKVNIQTPYKVETNKCKDAQVKLTSSKGYVPTRVILKMYTFNDKTYTKPNESISNIQIVENKTGLTIKNISGDMNSNLTNSSINPKSKPNRTLQGVMLVIIIIAVIIGIYYFYQQQQDNSE